MCLFVDLYNGPLDKLQALPEVQQVLFEHFEGNNEIVVRVLIGFSRKSLWVSVRDQREYELQEGGFVVGSDLG